MRLSKGRRRWEEHKPQYLMSIGRILEVKKSCLIVIFLALLQVSIAGSDVGLTRGSSVRPEQTPAPIFNVENHSPRPKDSDVSDSNPRFGQEYLELTKNAVPVTYKQLQKHRVSGRLHPPHNDDLQQRVSLAKRQFLSFSEDDGFDDGFTSTSEGFAVATTTSSTAGILIGTTTTSFGTTTTTMTTNPTTASTTTSTTTTTTTTTTSTTTGTTTTTTAPTTTATTTTTSTAIGRSSTTVESTSTTTTTTSTGSTATPTSSSPSGSASSSSSSTSTPSSAPNGVMQSGNTGSSNTGKTWGIVGGVIGGLIVIAITSLLLWRFTQRRFSDLDGDDPDLFKWPELQPDASSSIAPTSTLNPLGTRRTGGAGISIDGSESEIGGDMDHRIHHGGLGEKDGASMLNGGTLHDYASGVGGGAGGASRSEQHEMMNYPTGAPLGEDGDRYLNQTGAGMSQQHHQQLHGYDYPMDGYNVESYEPTLGIPAGSYPPPHGLYSDPYQHQPRGADAYYNVPQHHPQYQAHMRGYYGGGNSGEMSEMIDGYGPPIPSHNMGNNNLNRFNSVGARSGAATELNYARSQRSIRTVGSISSRQERGIESDQGRMTLGVQNPDEMSDIGGDVEDGMKKIADAGGARNGDGVEFSDPIGVGSKKK